MYSSLYHFIHKYNKTKQRPSKNGQLQWKITFQDQSKATVASGQTNLSNGEFKMTSTAQNLHTDKSDET